MSESRSRSRVMRKCLKEGFDYGLNESRCYSTVLNCYVEHPCMHRKSMYKAGMCMPSVCVVRIADETGCILTTCTHIPALMIIHLNTASDSVV